ncbi:MAG TPA: Dabb family protein [Ktedonobacterales bacterium]
MVRHEVIIRFRPEINEEVSERVIMEVVTLLKDIPGVVSVRYGTNQTPDYRHLMLEVLVPSESALQRFGRHPLHVRALRLLSRITATSVVSNVEVGTEHRRG